jgi:2-dehydropantoate 2-reductase
MLYDRLAGRPLEYDAIYGAVVRAGARHGIPTPLSETMAALLAAMSDASRPPTG